MKEMNKKYNIPQEILYSVCLTVWNLCAENIEKFAELKAYYTEAFIAGEIASVKEAMQLKNLIQKNAERKEARIILATNARQVMDNWQVLKLYIAKAFEDGLVDGKMMAAGASIYKKAALYNWSAVRSLILTANNFIIDNMEALIAKKNMPPGFKTKFSIDGDKFSQQSVRLG